MNFEVEPSKNPDWTFFGEEDPFQRNFIEGYISHHQGDDYGALFIEKVNGDKVPQLIYCTPKLRYPFSQKGDGTLNWNFPKAKRIERYEKLDGSNIFAFIYRDSKGTQFVSYKTRLRSFLGDSRFGPFKTMWKEILERWPTIQTAPLNLGMNLSFELWGARNPHLVKYDRPLEASLLFARNGQKILPPNEVEKLGNIEHHKYTSYLGLDTAIYKGNVDKDYIWNYQQSQQEMEGQLKQTDDGYMGQEGEVWYLLDETDNWTMFKCKPETIEAIHWSSGGITKNQIMATVWNGLENWDEPSVENVRTLLVEEFPESEVDKVHYLIEKCIKDVIALNEFKQKVLVEYRNLEPLNIIENKTEVMRAISNKFDRKMMSKVFSTIVAHEVK